MPFKAKVKGTQDIISIFDYAVPQIEIDRSIDLVCPFDDCAGRLMIVSEFRALNGSQKRRAHFRHHSNQCNTSYQYSPETPEHEAGKQLVIDLLKTNYPFIYKNASFDIEDYSLLDEIGRRPDIIAELEGGRKEAHEIQLSPITPEEILNRSFDFYKAEIDVIWYLGKGAAKAGVLDSLRAENIPFVGISINSTTKSLTGQREPISLV